MSLRILIIGGAGFIGSALALRLKEQGHSVHVLDRFTFNQVTQNELVENDIDVVSGNACILSVVYRYVSKVRPDVLILLANDTYDASAYSPSLEASSLVQIVTNVAQCLPSSTIRHVFFGSSAEVYGITPTQPISDHKRPNPVSTTGISFWWAERFLRAIQEREKYSFTFTSLRYFNIYGYRRHLHPKYDLVSFFVEHLMNNIPVAISGPSIRVDPLYVTDAVSATEGVIKHVTSREEIPTINIASGNGISQKKLYSFVADSIKEDKHRVFYLKKPKHLHHLVGDVSTLHNLGWSPSVSLEEGVYSIVQQRKDSM